MGPHYPAFVRHTATPASRYGPNLTNPAKASSTILLQPLAVIYTQFEARLVWLRPSPKRWKQYFQGGQNRAVELLLDVCIFTTYQPPAIGRLPEAATPGSGRKSEGIAPGRGSTARPQATALGALQGCHAAGQELTESRLNQTGTGRGQRVARGAVSQLRGSLSASRRLVPSPLWPKLRAPVGRVPGPRNQYSL